MFTNQTKLKPLNPRRELQPFHSSYEPFLIYLFNMPSFLLSFCVCVCFVHTQPLRTWSIGIPIRGLQDLVILEYWNLIYNHPKNLSLDFLTQPKHNLKFFLGMNRTLAPVGSGRTESVLLLFPFSPYFQFISTSGVGEFRARLGSSF